MSKNILLTIVLSLGFSFAFSGCCDSGESTKKEAVQVDKKNLEKVLINVEGMTCEGCEASIQTALGKTPGVVSAMASHVSKTTAIEYDKTKIDTAALEKVIVETGYKIIKDTEQPEKASPAAMKCAAGKCGEGKCGHAE